jgi:hypothetical protein
MSNPETFDIFYVKHEHFNNNFLFILDILQISYVFLNDVNINNIDYKFFKIQRNPNAYNVYLKLIDNYKFCKFLNVY